MTLHRTFRRLAFSGLILAATLPQALAQDAAAFEQRLREVFAEQGVNIEWSGIQQNGSTFTLQGVTIQEPAGADGTATTPFQVGDVVLSDVTEQNGGYRVGTATFPNFSQTEEGTTVEAGDISVTGLRIPAAGETDPIASLVLYEAADVGNVSIRQGDAEVFTLTDLHIELTPLDGNQPIEFSGAAERFTINFDTLPDPQTKAVLGELGYTQMNGFFEMAGAWDPVGGDLALNQYDFTVENAGTLGVTFDLGGYTADFMKSLQELQKQMAAQPEGADNSAQGLAMLGLMQQVVFDGASIRFDDDGLTQKIIDYVARQQNVSPDDIKNQTKAVVPFLTAQLNNPELSTQITGAVNAFLDNPQSLEISAEPAAPVPFSQIAAAATANPLELTRSLGLTVTANQGGEEDAGGGVSDGAATDDAGTTEGGEGQAQ